MPKKNVLFAFRGYVFLLALLLYLINMIISFKQLTILLNVTSICLFITALIGAGRFYSFMSFFLLICSIVLIEIRGLSLLDMVDGFSAMVSLILFVGIIPLVSFPVKGYVDEIKRMMIVLSHKVSPTKVCHYATYLLANGIVLAAIPISKILFFSDDTDRSKQLINAELSGRSFGLALMCTPIGAAIAVAIDMTGTNWISLLSVNMFIVIFGLWLSYYLVKRKIQLMDWKAQEIDLDTKKPNYIKLSQLLLPFAFYFVFVLVADGLSTLGIMELIVITVIPFTLLWSFFLKNITDWWLNFKSLNFQENPKSFGQYAVIISAGLLIYVLEITELDHELVQLLPGTGSEIAAYFYIPITILIVLLLSMIGVHQFVGMLFAGKLINPVIFGIDPTVFSSALLVGFVTGMLASTFSGANILMGNLVPGITSHDIGRENYLFTFLFICVSTVMLIGFNTFLL
ncbi:Uncharacterised protein [Mycobacteroides abscessus subsp. abscessus]|nr:Uncharacterised protein [Mycobacteroides abscessus subsp. abscessus]